MTASNSKACLGQNAQILATSKKDYANQSLKMRETCSSDAFGNIKNSIGSLSHGNDGKIKVKKEGFFGRPKTSLSID
jgi:hypothetical protein